MTHSAAAGVRVNSLFTLCRTSVDDASSPMLGIPRIGLLLTASLPDCDSFKGGDDGARDAST